MGGKYGRSLSADFPENRVSMRMVVRLEKQWNNSNYNDPLKRFEQLQGIILYMEELRGTRSGYKFVRYLTCCRYRRIILEKTYRFVRKGD